MFLPLGQMKGDAQILEDATSNAEYFEKKKKLQAWILQTLVQDQNELGSWETCMEVNGHKEDGISFLSV